MPELPEVETVRSGLALVALGQTVVRVAVRAPALRWPMPQDLHQRLSGQRLLAVRRRAKYLLLDFDTGTLIVHLGMSGNFVWHRVAPPAGRHDHLDIDFEHGTARLNDPRRFGAVLWHGAAEGPLHRHPLLKSLGTEPLSADFDGALLYRASRGRRTAVKPWLMAGDTVVGVGNIYASESLHRAGIHPGRAAGRIALARFESLAQAVRATLLEAIAQGGTTLRDFAGSDGGGGYFQLSCRVYGREGLPCPACAAPIRRSMQQQRASYFCPACQH